MAVPFLSSISLNKNEVQDFKVFNYAGDVTPLTGTDIGYFWTNTTGGKTLRWWDGSAVRTILDSSSTTVIAADLSGGTAGSLPYQQGASDTTFLGIGTAGQVLKVNSGATAPEWTAQSNLSVGTATFLAGGTAGDIPVQSAAGTTGFLNIGANGRILTSNGSTPVWSATIPSSSVSGLAASATTDTTNASNISSGLLPLARLALATGQFYLGDASNNPVATAKTSIPLSGFGAAGADVAMGGFKITGLADPVDATDAANRKYVDEVAQGLDVKASCLVGTIANINLSAPGSSIDGISLSSSNRVLVKDQTDKKQNGIYVWNGAAVAMTRSLDADTVAKLVGAFTFVEQGTNADSGWVCQVDSGTIGSVDIEWTKFSQAGSYTAGNGMVLSGGVFHFAQSSAYTAGQIPFCSNSPTANSIGFSSNLFWDNGNSRLGIGTPTPAYPLDISASKAVSRLTSSTGTNGAFSFFSNTGGAFYIGLDNSAGTEFSAAYSGAIWHSGAYPIVFATSNAEKMRLDSSGNLALAATPSAWISAYRAIEIGTTTGLYGRADSTMELSLALNCYRDNSGAWVYRNNGTAALYNQNVGYHYWYSATAGTATNNITFGDPKMTLDASGNLGLNTSSDPGYGRTTLSVYNSGGGLIKVAGSATTALLYVYQPDNTAVLATKTNHPFVFETNSTERLRLTANGEALFKSNGTASAPTIANADNPDTGLYWPNDNDTLALATGGSNRLYISADGETGIGLTPGGTGGMLQIGVPATQTGSGAANTVVGIDIKETVSGSGRGIWLGSMTNENTGVIGSKTASGNIAFQTYNGGWGERFRIKYTGQLNLASIAPDPTGAAGDLYYSTGNVLKMHNGTAWQQLSRKYTVALNDGSVTVVGNAYTITHNMGSKDITVSVRRTTDDVVVFADVSMPSTTTATVTFAAAITAANYVVTVIG